MLQFLFASFLLTLPLTGTASNDSERARVSAEIGAKYPIKTWKTIGFSSSKNEPLMEMKVPAFLNWDPKCVYHMVKNGIEYCGPDESSPRLTGLINIGGRDRVLQVGMEAYWAKKPVSSKVQHNPFAYWEANGALLSKKQILLDGYDALQGEIENTAGKLSPTSIQSETLIKFYRPHIGGMVYFIEGEQLKGEMKYVYHADRVFQDVIDGMIASFKFKVSADDASNPPISILAPKKAGKK